MKQILPLIASCVTVYNMYLAGNKDYRAWILGIINQFVWLAFIISFGAWGLLPLTIVLTFMYIRNLRKWRGDELEDLCKASISGKCLAITHNEPFCHPECGKMESSNENGGV